MYVAVIAHCRLHRVVRGLEVVARTYLKVKHIGAVSKSGRVIYRECLAAVIGVVVVTHSLAEAREQVACERERLVGREWQAEHAHSKCVPHAVHIGIGGGATTGS